MKAVPAGCGHADPAILNGTGHGRIQGIVAGKRYQR
jgi:hypothetical protein